MEPFNIQFSPGADNAFDAMPIGDRKLFANHVLLVLQSNPDRGNAHYSAYASPTVPGLFHLVFGSSIVSYSIDPTPRLVRVTDFSF